jgi:DGQHR domain-containing protein
MRTTLRLNVVKDVCLGREVFRGSAPAGALLDASWIDFHDRVNNPEGYQRPFDAKRSQRAREYADTVPDAFWPECVLAMRDNSETDDEEDKVEWTFTPVPQTGDRYGVLEVTYTPDRTTLINGVDEPWRRAFAQVDCQHRLGTMADSEKLVTFCVFPLLARREEAIIFRTINAKQRKISTSLVDAIILKTDPGASPHIRWAWDLGNDAGSPFNNRVWTGGRGRVPSDHLVTLGGLHRTLKVLAPHSLLAGGNTDEWYYLWYVFTRNFWLVVKSLWPTEFYDRVNYKLQTTPGQRGLAQFGQHILRKVLPAQDTRQKTIKAAFPGGGSRIDWSVNGEFRLATGKGGQRNVFEALTREYGLPS